MTKEITASQLGAIQHAWELYCVGRMTHEEFASFVAITLQLDNPSPFAAVSDEEGKK